MKANCFAHAATTLAPSAEADAFFRAKFAGTEAKAAGKKGRTATSGKKSKTNNTTKRTAEKATDRDKADGGEDADAVGETADTAQYALPILAQALHEHPLHCYMVGTGTAICDKCDLLRSPGSVVFGCAVCGFEMCPDCAIGLSPPGETQAVREVTLRCSRLAAIGAATSTWDADAGAPCPAACTAGAVHTSAEALPRSAAVPGQIEVVATPTRAIGGQGEDVTVVQCPQGGCAMHWTSRTKYFSYTCSGCGADGASKCGLRWHCATHREDYCGACRRPPPFVKATHHARKSTDSDVVDSAGACSARLDEMLAAEEEVARTRAVGMRSRQSASGGGCKRSAGIAVPVPVALTISEHDPRSIYGLMDENAAKERVSTNANYATAEGSGLLQRTCDLTLALAGDLLDELSRGYSQPWFQELVDQCAQESNFRREEFLRRLQEVAFEVQRPILENWGFEGNEQGVYDMVSILREHTESGDERAPRWINEKRDKCLALLYGGAGGGMLQ